MKSYSAHSNASLARLRGDLLSILNLWLSTSLRFFEPSQSGSTQLLQHYHQKVSSPPKDRTRFGGVSWNLFLSICSYRWPLSWAPERACMNNVRVSCHVLYHMTTVELENLGPERTRLPNAGLEYSSNCAVSCWAVSSSEFFEPSRAQAEPKSVRAWKMLEKSLISKAR